MTTNELLSRLINVLDDADPYTDHNDATIKADLKKQIINNPGALIEQLYDIIKDLLEYQTPENLRRLLHTNSNAPTEIITHYIEVLEELV